MCWAIFTIWSRPPRPRGARADEITVYKNGGGAHLDLMIADYIAAAVAG